MGKRVKSRNKKGGAWYNNLDDLTSKIKNIRDNAKAKLNTYKSKNNFKRTGLTPAHSSTSDAITSTIGPSITAATTTIASKTGDMLSKTRDTIMGPNPLQAQLDTCRKQLTECRLKNIRPVAPVVARPVVPRPLDARPVMPVARPVVPRPVMPVARPLDARPLDARPLDARPLDARPVVPRPVMPVARPVMPVAGPLAQEGRVVSFPSSPVPEKKEEPVDDAAAADPFGLSTVGGRKKKRKTRSRKKRKQSKRKSRKKVKKTRKRKKNSKSRKQKRR